MASERTKLDTNILKEKVAEAAIRDLVRNGMKIGLGTGSTALKATTIIGNKIRAGELKEVLIVPGSFETRVELQKYGVVLYSLNDPAINGELDLTIDGADEVDPMGNLIKGGGGGLLLEKIIGYASKEYCIIVDYSKIVNRLGEKRAIPVEVVPDAYISVEKILTKLVGKPEMRMAKMKAGPVITERGNIILDTKVENPEVLENIRELEIRINSIPGVVENGIFSRKLDHLYIAKEDGKVEKRR